MTQNTPFQINEPVRACVNGTWVDATIATHCMDGYLVHVRAADVGFAGPPSRIVGVKLRGHEIKRPASAKEVA